MYIMSYRADGTTTDSSIVPKLGSISTSLSIFGFSMNYQTKIVQYSDRIEIVIQDIHTNIEVDSKRRMHMTYLVPPSI